MIDIELLGMCAVDDAIVLYRNMILEYRRADPRLREVPTDDKSLRTLVSYSLDTENHLFFLLRRDGKPAGFVDSARVSDGNGDAWFIKAIWLEPNLRGSGTFRELLARLERGIRLKGVKRVFNTAFPGDGQADGLWAEAGYVKEGVKRVKTLR